MSVNGSPASVSVVDKVLRREIAKRRVFGFVAVLGLITAIGPIRQELDTTAGLADDLVFLVIVAAAIALIAAMRDKIALPQLKRQNTVLAALFGILLVSKVVAGFIEQADSADFADEVTVAILALLAVVDRFVW